MPRSFCELSVTLPRKRNVTMADDLREHLTRLAKQHEQLRGYVDDEVGAEIVRLAAPPCVAEKNQATIMDDVKQIAGNTDWPRFFKALASLRVQVTTATAAIGTVLVNGGFEWNDNTSTVVAVALTAWGAYLAYLDAQRKIGA